MISYENLDDARAAGVAPWDQSVPELSDFHITVFQDRYPVTRGHLLFVPNYNTDAVIIDCMESAMLYGRRMVEQGHCEGFNIGINMGPVAGQTVMYPHVHMIPRRNGDMPDPRGGVRHVIPEKGNYKNGNN